MEDFEREEGVSILALLKVMFGRKLLLLIVSVASAITLFLAIQFGLNTLKQVYKASFSFSDPQMIEGFYVDGSGFNYNSLITRENLQSIKDSNDLYKSINLDDLFENNGITISVEEVYSLDETTLRSQTYTLKTNKRYYSSAKQARSFIKDIIETSTRTNREKAQNLFYGSNLDAYENAETLDSKVYYLMSQYNYINNRYKTLKETYKDVVVKSTNKSLTSYQNDFNAAFYLNDYSVESLNSSLVNNVYVLDYADNEDLYRDNYTTYKTMYDKNQMTINNASETLALLVEKLKVNSEALEPVSKESINLITSLEQTILNATIENSDYASKIVYYANVLGLYSDNPDDENYSENYHPRATQAESEAFLTKLDASKEKLEEYTEIFRNVEAEVLTTNNNVYYSYNNIVVVSGGLQLVYAIIVSVVLGLMIGCCVNLIVDFKKLVPDNEKKEEPKAE